MAVRGDVRAGRGHEVFLVLEREFQRRSDLAAGSAEGETFVLHIGPGSRYRADRCGADAQQHEHADDREHPRAQALQTPDKPVRDTPYRRPSGRPPALARCA